MKDDETRIPIQWVPLKSNEPETINKAIDEIIRQLKYKSVGVSEPKVQEMINTTIISGVPQPTKICPTPSKVTGLTITDEPLYIDPTTGITLASVKVEWTNSNANENIDIYEILWVG